MGGVAWPLPLRLLRCLLWRTRTMASFSAHIASRVLSLMREILGKYYYLTIMRAAVKVIMDVNWDKSQWLTFWWLSGDLTKVCARPQVSIRTKISPVWSLFDHKEPKLYTEILASISFTLTTHGIPLNCAHLSTDPLFKFDAILY